MSEFTDDEVRILKSIASGFLNAQQGGKGGGGGESVAPLEDAQLDKDWADKAITKNPPKWSGDNLVGVRYSAAPPEWHETNASFLLWKVKKEKEKDAPRLKNNGKPWYESDEFEAKLCLAWARRLRNGGAKPAAAPRAAQSAPVDELDTRDDDIPF